MSGAGRSGLSLIAAVARNRVIGDGPKLPWHLPEDLQYFKRVTSGHPIVMGRKTYESIGRLLPGRENRIVTRQPGFAVPGARVFSTVSAACERAEGSGAAEVFVIGGAQIYAEALPLVDRLYLTTIDRDFAGDVLFPEWRRSDFREISREAHAPDPAKGRDFGYDFVIFERTSGAS